MKIVGQSSAPTYIVIPAQAGIQVKGKKMKVAEVVFGMLFGLLGVFMLISGAFIFLFMLGYMGGSFLEVILEVIFLLVFAGGLLWGGGKVLGFGKDIATGETPPVYLDPNYVPPDVSVQTPPPNQADSGSNQLNRGETRAPEGEGSERLPPDGAVET
jgi:hypothetical protein